MKKIFIVLLLVSLVQANDSTIHIQGNMHGDINKNRGDVINGNVVYKKNFNVKLNLTNNRQYHNNYTKNITTIIKQDKKLLKKFQEQFSNIGEQNIRLENLNYEQKRLLKVIEIKLITSNNISKENQNLLTQILGDVNSLKLDLNYLGKVTSNINIIVSSNHTVSLKILEISKQTKKRVDSIDKTTQNTNQILNELNNKINKPNIIHDINWNLNSFCQEHNIKYIDEITFNVSNSNAINTLDYKHELEKINCLKTLYSKSRQQKYELHVFGSNANDTYKVVEAIKLYGEVDEQNIFQQANYHHNDGVVYVRQVAR